MMPFIFCVELMVDQLELQPCCQLTVLFRVYFLRSINSSSWQFTLTFFAKEYAKNEDQKFGVPLVIFTIL